VAPEQVRGDERRRWIHAKARRRDEEEWIHAEARRTRRGAGRGGVDEVYVSGGGCAGAAAV
jgi:hypothetical protein